MNQDREEDVAIGALNDQLRSDSINIVTDDEDDEHEEDDDFGSFDDATFEDRTSDFSEKVQKSMDLVFSGVGNDCSHKQTDTDILSLRSRAILGRLLTQGKPNSFKWHKSLLKRQLFLYLGLPVNLDDMTEVSISSSMKGDRTADVSHLNVHATTGFSKEELKEKLHNTDDELKKIQRNVQSAYYYKQARIPEHTLNSTAETLEGYEKLLKDILGHYMALESELLKDQQLYESYVENMVDNTQKLRRKATLRMILSRKKK